MSRVYSLLGLLVIFAVFAFSTSQVSGQSKAEPVKVGESATEKININKATAEQLMEMKGIGESYAKRIIEYREKNGPFKKAEDIMEVQGIGQKLFDTIKDKISI